MESKILRKYNCPAARSIFADAKIIHRFSFQERKSNSKNYLVNIHSEFQCENAESLPVSKIIKTCKCQCTLSTLIVSGIRNLSAVISALCIHH